MDSKISHGGHMSDEGGHIQCIQMFNHIIKEEECTILTSFDIFCFALRALIYSYLGDVSLVTDGRCALVEHQYYVD